jgi:hypothetical protein
MLDARWQRSAARGRRGTRSAAGERALLAAVLVIVAPAAPAHPDESDERAGGDIAGALHDGGARHPPVVAAGGGCGHQVGGDLLAVGEDRPEEDRLQAEREQKPQRLGRGLKRGRDGDDDRDHQRIQRLDEHRRRQLAKPIAKEVVAGAGEDPDHQRHRREPEQNKRDDLRQDHRQREEPQQHDGAQDPDEDDQGQREPLIGAVLLLDVHGGGVGLVDLVAAHLRRLLVGRDLALAQRVVLGVALVRSGRVAQEPCRVPAVPVGALAEVVAAHVARRVMRADRTRVAVAVAAVGVDAVTQAAELQDHPRPVDERLEQLVGDVLLGLAGSSTVPRLVPDRNASDIVFVQLLACPIVFSGS